MCMGDMDCICEDVTETFKKLSNFPQEVSDDDLQKLENFVVLMHDQYSADSCVNEARLDRPFWIFRWLVGQICLVYLMESSRQFWCLYHHLHDYVAYLHLAAQLLDII